LFNIETAHRCWFRWECLHCARTSYFNCSDWRCKSMFGS